MYEKINLQQSEISKMIERYVKQDGVYETAIPSLFFIKASHITDPLYTVYKPSFCIIVQGKKEVILAEESFRYGPGDYIVASVDLPVTGQVIRASADEPYLALKLEFTPNEIIEILSDSNIRVGLNKRTDRAMFISQIESSLMDAVTRFIQLLENPEDISVLAPIFKKEILYRILQGPHGNVLQQVAVKDSYAYRIREVIDYITQYYNRTLRIEELAEIANMGVSTLHRHFKEVTGMSPIQFQKQLKLQEARRVLLSESTDAADVAFRVGYESPSQFSREYSRMFGLPPLEDIKRLKDKYAQRINS